MGIAMANDESKEIAVTALGERLGALRLCEASALEGMRRSLARHGQMTAVVGFAAGELVEVIDGFKRLRAARALGWATLRTRVIEIDAVAMRRDPCPQRVRGYARPGRLVPRPTGSPPTSRHYTRPPHACRRGC
jgi:hypothetical protein